MRKYTVSVCLYLYVIEYTAKSTFGVIAVVKRINVIVKQDI